MMVFQLWDNKLLLEPAPDLPVANHVDCCCPSGQPCDWCSGGMPLQVQVNLAGISDNGCDECDPNLNDSFIADRVSTGSTCYYEYLYNPFGCANIGCGVGEWHQITIRVYHTKSGADYILRTIVYECQCLSLPTDTCLESARFEKNYSTSKPNCLLAATETLPLVSDSGVMCDFSVATCTVEPVP